MSKKESIILIGAGGHCISAIDIIESANQYEIKGILDMPDKVGQSILGYPIIGSDDQIQELVAHTPNFLITVGQIRNANIRKKIVEKVIQANGKLPVISSGLAYISRHADVEDGTILMHGAVINAGAKIGKACIINSKALIEHEATVGDFTHISTACILNGQVSVGSNCFIGSNTVIANNITICDNVILAAGSQVLKSITKPGIYIGSPLRKIR
ncbi:acetyltransferase [Draconibacterium orientale]|uniref:acetyltransferase n=1 Tax=Draconibacterium orientale TaxID=1168034 RepID=UPI002A0A44FD|nr:acetyltransferase [Draconibacterium orientale]